MTNNFDNLFESIVLGIGKGGTRNMNNLKGRPGKYFKGLKNTSKMVSNQDKNRYTKKGDLQNRIDQMRKGSKLVISKLKFDKYLNNAGKRSIDLSKGDKSINSKLGGVKASLSSNGKSVTLYKK